MSRGRLGGVASENLHRQNPEVSRERGRGVKNILTSWDIWGTCRRHPKKNYKRGRGLFDSRGNERGGSIFRRSSDEKKMLREDGGASEMEGILGFYHPSVFKKVEKMGLSLPSP